MFNEKGKIYKYFYQDMAEADKKLASLLRFDSSSFLSSPDQVLFVDRLKLISDNFLKKDLNENFWLDKQLFNFLDLDLVDKFLSSPDKDKVDLLLDNIKLVNTILGEEDNLTRYSSLEIISCLNLSKVDFDYYSLIYSLRQEITDQYNRDLVKAIFAYLQKVELYKDWDIKDLILFVFVINIVWKNFDFLLPVEQTYLLNLFFFISLFIGVPVNNILKNNIYQTNNPVDFVVRNKFFLDALDKNIELVPADENIEKVIDLNEVFKNFSTANQSVDIFVKNNYKVSKKSLLGSLTEALNIYDGLKNSNLIEKNYAGEDNEADVYNKEVSDLLTWFIAKEDWNKIVDYYKNKTAKVSPDVFISILPLFIDLEKSEAVEKISEFTDFLKMNRLIPSNIEIIEYHESDSEFHWTNWVTK